MINLNEAHLYLQNHLFNEKWIDASEIKRQSALNFAETVLKSHFNLKGGYEKTDNWFHAVCEQAIHLMNYAPERYQLQQEGVGYYAVDGITFTMKQNLISPVAKGFMKNITIKRRVGDIK